MKMKLILTVSVLSKNFQAGSPCIYSNFAFNFCVLKKIKQQTLSRRFDKHFHKCLMGNSEVNEVFQMFCVRIYFFSEKDKISVKCICGFSVLAEYIATAKYGWQWDVALRNQRVNSAIYFHSFSSDQQSRFSNKRSSNNNTSCVLSLEMYSDMPGQVFW